VVTQYGEFLTYLGRGSAMNVLDVAHVRALSTCSGPASQMLQVAHIVLVSAVSRPNSGLSDVEPRGVCLGPELSLGGGGEPVSTRAEVVGDGAKRDQETLRVLG
jgi:hypothetical protein